MGQGEWVALLGQDATGPGMAVGHGHEPEGCRGEEHQILGQSIQVERGVARDRHRLDGQIGLPDRVASVADQAIKAEQFGRARPILLEYRPVAAAHSGRAQIHAIQQRHGSIEIAAQRAREPEQVMAHGRRLGGLQVRVVRHQGVLLRGGEPHERLPKTTEPRDQADQATTQGEVEGRRRGLATRPAGTQPDGRGLALQKPRFAVGVGITAGRIGHEVGRSCIERQQCREQSAPSVAWDHLVFDQHDRVGEIRQREVAQEWHLRLQFVGEGGPDQDVRRALAQRAIQPERDRPGIG